MERGFAFDGKAWVGGCEKSTFDWTGKKLKKPDELRSPHANGPALRKSNKKGADLAIHPFMFASSFSLAAFGLRNHFVEFENRQEHRDDDSAHDEAENYDKHRLDQ
jgi:hypothetical protein